MNKNANFFIDVLRLMPNDASAVLYSTEEEILKAIKKMVSSATIDRAEVIIPLTSRRELIKALVCSDVLPRIVHITILKAETELYNSYDRMMGCYLHKPLLLPPHFTAKYSLQEYETGWEFCGEEWDGIEQYILIL
ncbi:hypothetical protein [Hymenobacter sp. GOD-10R]|uniref:hypothetical protein n=1 Tax=Hymenobacter sp. GOD-10R TaxID=3093922 RepID=UPI002D79E9BF|nr:hypothetical protein [Hymenobacter sp. GOD-10R]WRQ27949.1 hypothetical protein SD425_23025 [Hymenobacter sp. GOD-10R]